MSRLVGTVSKENAGVRARRTDRMLAAYYGNGWVANSATSGHATFGWAGWHQPKLAIVQHVLVALDGSIYNRDELGDAKAEQELLAALYLKYGFRDAICQLNGDFAVALYDSRLDHLWLARDRFGVKPLYYVNGPEFFAFASQPRSLLTLPSVNAEVDRQFVAVFAASHYRYFDNNPERSPYAHIAQLPAAHTLKWTPGRVATASYWLLADRPDFEESEEMLAERYRALLHDAVSIRLRATRRPAFTLSGGMDSSSVLASAVCATKVKPHAFSSVYPDKTFDESEEIRPMLQSYVEEWHPITVDPHDVFELIERMVRYHDEPVATATWLSHFLVCQEVAKQGFSGIFGGLGGDELNAGEYEYFLYHFADLRVAGCKDDLDREVWSWMQHHNHPIFKKDHTVVEDGLSRLVDLTSHGKCLQDERRLFRYISVLNPDFFDLKTFTPIMDHPYRVYLKNRAYQDIFRETAPCCLRAEDRQTTIFGLDHFLPFFDHQIVEFMFRIPGRLKIRNGVTKRLLREAMRGILPEETRTRIKKTGWNAPAHRWFSGTWRERLLDLVNSQRFRQRGIYDIAKVEHVIEEHEAIVQSGAPRDNHMMFLWQLVNLEIWLQQVAEIGVKDTVRATDE